MAPVTVMKIFEELNVPENIRNHEIKTIEGVTEYQLHHGNSKMGYHGYREGFEIFDPYIQLIRVKEEEVSDQYIRKFDCTYKYKGEKPCAALIRYAGINAFKTYFVLFLRFNSL